MQKISTCLWFDKQAEEAVKFYTTVFKNSKIGTTTRYDETVAKAAGMPVGTVMTITFELEGREFMALNGGPLFKFNEAISLVVNCKSQAEIDEYWNKLTSNGGEESMCGWLKDKYGLSWQIVPEAWEKMMSDKDTEKSKRAMEALMKMKKIELPVLEQAYEGKVPVNA
ncbi:MAG: VOC family protein [Ignavibacteriae bacterium]|nr:MAG: VOC family protein [Ignavibacteriota bacterium]